MPLIDLKLFEVAMKRKKTVTEGRNGRGGEEESRERGGWKEKRWKESGERDISREGSTVWSQEERMRDEGKQGMDRWLEG